SDRTERRLPHLRAAAHDDDSLAVDLGERRRQLGEGHAGHLPQVLDDRLRWRGTGEFEIDLRALIVAWIDVHSADVGLVVEEDSGQTEQDSRLIGDCGENGVRGHAGNVTRSFRAEGFELRAQPFYLCSTATPQGRCPTGIFFTTC